MRTPHVAALLAVALIAAATTGVAAVAALGVVAVAAFNRDCAPPKRADRLPRPFPHCPLPTDDCPSSVERPPEAK